jgi:hypothetical protein
VSPTDLLEPPVAGAAPEAAEAPAAAGPGAEERPADRHVPVLSTVLGTACTSAAAGWVLAGIFSDFWFAHAVALVGVALGSGLILLSFRVRASAAVQFLLVPVALAAGALLIAPSTHGGLSLSDLVTEAVRQGGLLQPPIAFDPGWRFILVALCVLVSGGSAALGVATDRAKLGVLAPLPIAFAAALIQPSGAVIPSVAVGVILGVIGMTLAEGAELARTGVVGTAFALRRVARASVIAGGLAVVLVLLSSVGFLFPQPNADHVIPPQKPPVPPPVADTVLLRDTGLQGNVLRMGVIDIYDGKQQAWLLPPYDPATLVHHDQPDLIGAPPPKDTPTYQVTVEIANLPGHYLPIPAGAYQVSGLHAAVDVDPRTGTLKLSSERAQVGMRYTVTAPALPGGAALAKAGPPPASMRPFLDAPAPPSAVTDLLAQYRDNLVKTGATDNAYDRLQFVRAYFLSRVVAAGEGVPTDLTPQRVVAELGGADATPYEITASEALLARWAGVPARIGYGYYGGDPVAGGQVAVHPRHAAMWLEVWFNGGGWVPLTGVPPKAQQSTDTKPKNSNPLIHPSGRLALQVYVPVDVPKLSFLYEYARYYAMRVLPVLALLLLAFVAFPWPVKLLRRQRRRRWAMRVGPDARIAVAYAEWRDLANDLGVGGSSATPVRFLDSFHSDPALEELAWLATRALWGDLRRDLRDGDAVAAEQLASSLGTRLRMSQPGTIRVLGAISRASLRAPYTRAVPNLWPERGEEETEHLGRRERLRLWRRARRLRQRLAATTALLSVLLLSACGAGSQPAPARHLGAAVAPSAVGELTVKRETAAEKLFTHGPSGSMVSQGEVYSIHHDVLVEGSFQVSVFKPQYSTDDLVESMTRYCTANLGDCPGHQIVRSIQDNLSAGTGQRLYWKGERLYWFQLAGQRLYMWFPPHGETLAVLVLRDQIGTVAMEDIAHALMDFENGRPMSTVHTPSVQDEIKADATPSADQQATS